MTLQLSWFVDEGLLGEVVAQEKGFYAEEGIDLEIVPGGPNNDGVAPVASGKADIGLASSSPSLMLAVSQGIPVQAFGVQLQEHPYAFISMPDTPLESAEDLAGLKVGVPATSVELVEAVLAANGMSTDDLDGIQNISFEVGPLLQGKVDVWGGWLTDTAQLDLLPEDYNAIRLWDNGVQLYAGIYFSNPEWLEENPELAEGFLRATARGWEYAQENLDESAEIMVAEFPDIEGGADPEAIAEGAATNMEYMFTAATDEGGWGTMDPAVWQSQIDLWEETGRFDKEPPTLDEVVNTTIVENTEDARKGE